MMERYTGKFQKKASPRRRSALIWGLFAALALISSTAAGLGVYVWQLDSSASQFEALAALTENIPQVQTQSAATRPTEPLQPTQLAQSETEPVSEKVMLTQYAQLYQQNPDFWGWISIADTKINYPVMHTPEDPEKYLYLDFSGNYSFPGTPFLDAQCGEDSDNLILYSHNMNNGTMFHDLLKYESSTFWKSHPVVCLDSLYETREYEVIAAFYDRIYQQNETAFRFYQLIDAQNEEEFDQFVANLKKKSLYDTGVTAEYGDQLLTLVTCSAHMDNGRFVLVVRWRQGND